MIPADGKCIFRPIASGTTFILLTKGEVAKKDSRGAITWTPVSHTTTVITQAA